MAVEHEWAKRVRAAAAYAGLGYGELAEKLGMSDSTLRRHLAATKRPHEVRALVQTVAEITELPDEFFTVDYAALPDLVAAAGAPGPALTDQVRAVLQAPEFRDSLVDALLDIDPEVLRRIADGAEARDSLEVLTRRTKAALVAGEGDDARSRPAAADTRNEAASPPAAGESHS